MQEFVVCANGNISDMPMLFFLNKIRKGPVLNYNPNICPFHFRMQISMFSEKTFPRYNSKGMDSPFQELGRGLTCQITHN